MESTTPAPEPRHRRRPRRHGQAEAARLAPCGDLAPRPGGRHRPDLPGARGPGQVGAVVFTVTAVLLFGTSAIYHRGTWSPEVHGVLKRMDHSNIFLIIAGTYTPFALTLLPMNQARTLLLIVWGGAIGGVLFRVFWVGAPRWLYTPIYVALGWVAIFYFGPFLHFGGPAIITLITVGGLLYTLGAVVYGTKHPNPFPSGSASTRSSTPSRSRPSSCTTSRPRSRSRRGATPIS